MDEASTNWKLFELIKKDREEKEKKVIRYWIVQFTYNTCSIQIWSAEKWLGYKINI